MKKILLSLSIVMLAAVANAQPPAGDAKPGDWYGEKVTTNGAVSLNEVANKLNDGKEKVDGKITAKVVDVCPKKGCWIKLAVNDSTTATVTMKDYGFFVPLAAIGKTVVIDGEVKVETTSVARLKHVAEDKKKSKEEIDAINKPEKEISIKAKGIVVVN